MDGKTLAHKKEGDMFFLCSKIDIGEPRHGADGESDIWWIPSDTKICFCFFVAKKFVDVDFLTCNINNETAITHRNMSHNLKLSPPKSLLSRWFSGWNPLGWDMFSRFLLPPHPTQPAVCRQEWYQPVLKRLEVEKAEFEIHKLWWQCARTGEMCVGVFFFIRKLPVLTNILRCVSIWVERNRHG